jgi:hypothetical protein
VVPLQGFPFIGSPVWDTLEVVLCMGFTGGWSRNWCPFDGVPRGFPMGCSSRLDDLELVQCRGALGGTTGWIPGREFNEGGHLYVST